MSTNNKISSAVSGQLPFFVRNDHPDFIAFLEAYYEFLEQSETTLADGQVIDRAKNLPAYKDIDSTIDEFSDRLYKKFLDGFPVNTLGNRALIMKHIKDFYRAKGTEKSYRFLMRALYGKEIEFYYPKEDVLRPSDGKWYIQKSIRVVNTTINGISNNNISGLELYVNRQITGNTSGATATIESIDRYYTAGTQIDELTISNIVGSFESEEGISTSFNAETATYNVNSTIIGSVVNTVTIVNAGLGYKAGDPVIVLSSSGAGACVVVGTVTSGNVSSITVTSGGSGYRANDFLLITSATGSGANGYVAFVNTDQTVHPNTYNIWMSTIDLEANTPINNLTYSNLNASITDPANNWLQNSWTNFVYSNTGPATIITMSSSGTGYQTLPTISILANTRVVELGILGRMNVVNSGNGYAVGDAITFTNIPGGFGVGALANVKTVNGIGAITSIQYTVMGGHLAGGSGYDINYLPRANVVNTLGTGRNANVVVTELLGTGGSFTATNSSIGAIQSLRIISGGSNYTTVPTLSLSGKGDGTAQAAATILSGVFTYPGRYLNDDGQLSSYNFLQDRDYYQNFSYVIRVKKSIAEYRKVLKDLVHPAGMKLFGEYMELDENQSLDVVQNAPIESIIKFNDGTYSSGNLININYTDHGQVQNGNVYLEFTSGNLTTYGANGLYMIRTVANANTFTVNTGSTIYVVSSGNVSVGRIVA